MGNAGRFGRIEAAKGPVAAGRAERETTKIEDWRRVLASAAVGFVDHGLTSLLYLAPSKVRHESNRVRFRMQPEHGCLGSRSQEGMA